jgi:hypothetical protein
VQNAKDTFYEMLRERLATINPERTAVVRGLTRPAVLVEENELVTEFLLPDCFRLRWLEESVDASGAMPLVTMQCAIDYETAGTGVYAGMDRGRTLAAMDAELFAALNMQPQRTPKYNYALLVNGKPAAAMKTQVWWSEPSFSKVERNRDRMARTATVMVMSYQERGEL